jgi:transcriptional regulator with XRE-family HTH domain
MELNSQDNPMRSWRSALGLTLEEAAGRLGVTLRHVSRLESGRTYEGRISRPTGPMLRLMSAIKRHGPQRRWPE